MKPKRIQRKRTKGFSLQGASPNGLPVVYVGRPSKWGNNYIVGTESHDEDAPPIDAKAAVELFQHYQIDEMRDDGIDFNELRGKNLACWCPLDQPCHADVLLELANP